MGPKTGGNPEAEKLRVSEVSGKMGAYGGQPGLPPWSLASLLSGTLQLPRALT